MPQRFFEKRRTCRVSFDEEANFALLRTRDRGARTPAADRRRPIQFSVPAAVEAEEG